MSINTVTFDASMMRSSSSLMRTFSKGLGAVEAGVEFLNSEELKVGSIPPGFGQKGQGASTNMMSGNFASFDKEEPKYFTAWVATTQAKNDMLNRQNAILAMALAEVDLLDTGSYAARSSVGTNYARMMKKDQEQSAFEASERNLEENKEAIEKAAREAMAPKDADGEPVPVLEAGEGATEENRSATAPKPVKRPSKTAQETAPALASGEAQQKSSPLELRPIGETQPLTSPKNVTTSTPSLHIVV